MFWYKMLIAFIIGVTFGLLIPTGPAYGNVHEKDYVCITGTMDRKVAGRGLKEMLNQTPSFIGLVTNKAILEIFISPLRTFTIIVTDTNNKSCVIVGGESLEQLTVPFGRGGT